MNVDTTVQEKAIAFPTDARLYHKAKKRLGWKTKLDVNETIEWTVNWYKEHFKNSDMKEYTENQIDKFMSL